MAPAGRKDPPPPRHRGRGLSRGRRKVAGWGEAGGGPQGSGPRGGWAPWAPLDSRTGSALLKQRPPQDSAEWSTELATGRVFTGATTVRTFHCETSSFVQTGRMLASSALQENLMRGFYLLLHLLLGCDLQFCCLIRSVLEIFQFVISALSQSPPPAVLLKL